MTDDQVKTWSELKKTGFMALKRYVKAVGLAMPPHVTKGNLLKLIKKEGKCIDDTLEEVTEVVGASASSIEYSKSLNRRESASGFNESDFLRSGGQNGEAKAAVARFGEHLGGKQHAQRLFNALAYIEHEPDRFEQAVLNADIDFLGDDLIERLNQLNHNAHLWNNINWEAANNHEYEIGQPDEKYLRFFRYVGIPNVRERIAGMARLIDVRKELLIHHKFSHHVHVALTKLVADQSKVRYLMGALLFYRARDMKINLASRNIRWESEAEEIVLLRWLMEHLSHSSTAQDSFIARNFDKVFEDEKVARTADRGMGFVMHQFVRTQSGDELEEILETYVIVDQDELEEPVSPGPGNALLSELKDRTADSRVEATDFEALREIQERKKLETIQKKKIKKKASDIIGFSLPRYVTQGVENSLRFARNFVNDNHLDSQQEFVQEMETSLERLEETSRSITGIWENCERIWFEMYRTEYIKQMGDPQFDAVYQVVDSWNMFLPDTVWGHIWEYRAPFEKKVDLRFALEVHQEFGDVYGIGA